MNREERSYRICNFFSREDNLIMRKLVRSINDYILEGLIELCRKERSKDE